MSSRRDPLHALLHLRRDAFERAAAEAATDPRDPQLKPSLDALEHLDSLIAAHARITRRGQRWGLVALFALLVLLALAATLRHVASATVDVKVTASSVRMRSGAQQTFTELIGVKDVVLTGLQSVEGPSELGFGQPTGQLRLQGTGEQVSIEPIVLQPGTLISLEMIGPGRYRLSLKAASAITLSFSLVGEVRAILDGPGRNTRTLLAKPREVVARWKPREQATLTFSTDETLLTKPVDIDMLEFAREEFVADNQLLVSTVNTGEILYADYERFTLPIAEGAMLTLGGLHGYARRVAVRDGALAVSFRGTASLLQIGEGGGRRNRLPTWSDTLTKSSYSFPVITATFALIGTLVGLWNWWRDSK
jgi:hypothetical protein